MTKAKGDHYILLSWNEALDNLEHGGFRQDICSLREEGGRGGGREKGRGRERGRVRDPLYLASSSQLTHQVSSSSLGDKWRTRHSKTQNVILKEIPLQEENFRSRESSSFPILSHNHSKLLV